MFIGILFLVLTSILWVVQGVVVSVAAEKKLNLSAIQTVMAFIIMCLTLPLFFVAGKVNIIIVIALIVGGICNCGANLLMNLAMKNGPHGMTWAISQSAFVIPFIMGIFVFKVPCSPIRAAGIILLLISMAVMGIYGKKDEGGQGTGKFNWIIFCVLAYIVIGMSQCGGSLPSYFIADSVSSISNVLFRVGLLCTGIFIGGLLNWMFVDHIPVCRNGFAKQTFLLTASTITSSLLTFKAFDIITGYDAGAIGYPVITGLSIAFFFVYTAVKLKEKLSIPAIIGVLLCLTGIAGIIF